ncbi:MAG: hypothetical protein ACD_39C00568G0002 [uncultured bacterium]|nr:MAG: hypothetical protein ACD_39C00568G0002 [uncultured bacterium]
MKNSVYFLVLATCFLAGAVFAGPYRAEDIDDIKQVYQDTPLALTRLMLDLHLSYFERNAVKFLDVRISPLIRAENHFEVPVEMGFVLTENQIPLSLRGFEESSGGKLTSTPRAITISVSAESAPDGQPFLTMMVNAHFSSNTGSDYDNSLQKAFEAFSKVTTFSPRIKKAVLSPQNKKDGNPVTVNNGSWITNMRVDSDKRMQLTGYATEARLVNQLCRELEKTGAFSDIWLSSMTRNVYEKQPVMRFDLQGQVTSALENKSN